MPVVKLFSFLKKKTNSLRTVVKKYRGSRQEANIALGPLRMECAG